MNLMMLLIFALQPRGSLSSSIVEAYSAAGKIHLRQQVEDQKEYAI